MQRSKQRSQSLVLTPIEGNPSLTLKIGNPCYALFLPVPKHGCHLRWPLSALQGIISGMFKPKTALKKSSKREKSYSALIMRTLLPLMITCASCSTTPKPERIIPIPAKPGSSTCVLKNSSCWLRFPEKNWLLKNNPGDWIDPVNLDGYWCLHPEKLKELIRRMR